MLKINNLFKQFKLLKLASNHFARFNNVKINKSVLLNSNNNTTDKLNNDPDEKIVSDKTQNNPSIENFA